MLMSCWLALKRGLAASELWLWPMADYGSHCWFMSTDATRCWSDETPQGLCHHQPCGVHKADDDIVNWLKTMAAIALAKWTVVATATKFGVMWHRPRSIQRSFLIHKLALVILKPCTKGSTVAIMLVNQLLFVYLRKQLNISIHQWIRTISVNVITDTIQWRHFN